MRLPPLLPSRAKASAGWYGDFADGQRHPAERRAGGRVLCNLQFAGAAGLPVNGNCLGVPPAGDAAQKCRRAPGCDKSGQIRFAHVSSSEEPQPNTSGNPSDNTVKCPVSAPGLQRPGGTPRASWFYFPSITAFCATTAAFCCMRFCI